MSKNWNHGFERLRGLSSVTHRSAGLDQLGPSKVVAGRNNTDWRKFKMEAKRLAEHVRGSLVAKRRMLLNGVKGKAEGKLRRPVSLAVKFNPEDWK